jgi:hypothetical protein
MIHSKTIKRDEGDDLAGETPRKTSKDSAVSVFSVFSVASPA